MATTTSAPGATTSFSPIVAQPLMRTSAFCATAFDAAFSTSVLKAARGMAGLAAQATNASLSIRSPEVAKLLPERRPLIMPSADRLLVPLRTIT